MGSCTYLVDLMIKDTVIGLIYFGGYGCRKHNELSDCFDVHDAFWEGQIYWGWHNDVHVFDTTTQTWFQPTIRGGEPPQPRAAHTCAVLGNKGYVFGGRVLQSRMNDLHCLNLDTWTWSGSCLSLCKTVEYNCFDYKSVWIPLKMIYTQNQNERINYSKNQPWTAKTRVSVHTTPLTIFMVPTSIYNARIHTNGEKPKDRSWHTLTSVGDDKLFLFGGLSSDNVPLSDGWIHSTTTNGWRQLTHLPKSRPRLWHTACLGKEGEVMVFGGSKDDLHFMDTGHCSDLLIFQTEPYSLLRLCLDCIGKNATFLKNQISWLPPGLLQQVLKKITFWAAVKHRQEKRAETERQDQISVT
ncbi:PREDICTED: kelch domain-containing protein 1 isoform X3 [Gavialis gangeticus]|uniref:kelch domain-containing protein 1 isoform X3 n=1 Tax=Gavialis gangeticus TaxID=94835 RepID=UPI00092E234A|nr:PREDICTED: kelch domain-containing protein 1 isoform X3 [Gavialis gangeticus]